MTGVVPIGHVHSGYTDPELLPPQSLHNVDATGSVVVRDELVDAIGWAMGDRVKIRPVSRSDLGRRHGPPCMSLEDHGDMDLGRHRNRRGATGAVTVA